VQSVRYPIAIQVSNNEETLEKDNKQQNYSYYIATEKANSKIQHVLRVIVTDEQVTTPQHTEQQEGKATAAAVDTSYLHRFESTTKIIHA
jgi:hypothetical protein